MRKGIYKDEVRGTWYISTRIKIEGEFKTFTARGYQTKFEANNDYERCTNKFIKDNSAVYKVVFFEDLCEEYISFRKLTVRLQTMRGDMYGIDKYMKSFKGKMISACLNKKSIEKWFASLNSQKTSSARKNKIITLMKDILKFAYQKMYIDASTYQICDVSIYKIMSSNRPRIEKVIWTKEQMSLFFNIIPRDSKDYVMFKLYAFLGCRIGEFQGLKVKCFDSTRKTIQIYQQVIEATGKNKWELVDYVKTTDSYRTITLSDEVYSILKEYIVNCDLGIDDFLFFGKKPLSRNTIRRKMYQYTVTAGIPKTTPHGLRHTMDTMLMQVCENAEDIKIAAKRQGHSATMMLDTYGHVLSANRESELIKAIS